MFKVAIVGKPNVGKSTLFNRLAQKRKAITDKVMGVTRDRNGVVVHWLKREFFLFDTGGLVKDQTNDLQSRINEQTLTAINEADLVILLVSVKDGIDQNDRFIARMLKKQDKAKVILALNKTENASISDCHNKEVYGLGFGQPLAIASEHGIGIGQLLNEVISYVDKFSQHDEQTNIPTKFCIIGRPNVGKSTIINALVNQNRVIVSPQAGTTRDAIDVPLRFNQHDFVMIDTAGIRKKGKIEQGVENYAVQKALDAIKRSEIICFVVDVSQEFSEQDEVIGGLAWKANIPTIVLANKRDLINNSAENIALITKTFRNKFRFLTYAPIIFISGLEKQNLAQIFSTIEMIQKEQKIKVPTNLLNSVIQKIQATNNAPMFKGGRLQITYANQIESQNPSFVCFCNDPKFLHFSYARYIENQIRDAFGIRHVPLMLYFKSKNARDRKKTKASMD